MLKVINVKGAHVLVKEQRGVYGRVWREERRGKNNAIILYSQKPHICPPFKLCCHNDGKWSNTWNYIPIFLTVMWALWRYSLDLDNFAQWVNSEYPTVWKCLCKVFSADREKSEIDYLLIVGSVQSVVHTHSPLTNPYSISHTL